MYQLEIKQNLVSCPSPCCRAKASTPESYPKKKLLKKKPITQTVLEKISNNRDITVNPTNVLLQNPHPPKALPAAMEDPWVFGFSVLKSGP